MRARSVLGSARSSRPAVPGVWTRVCVDCTEYVFRRPQASVLHRRIDIRGVAENLQNPLKGARQAYLCPS
jgi:hypothetical protein